MTQTTQVNLRLDPELLAEIDIARGDVPRNRWILRAIEAALGVAASPRLGDPRRPERPKSEPVETPVAGLGKGSFPSIPKGARRK
jgi:hypothetical protein